LVEARNALLVGLLGLGGELLANGSAAHAVKVFSDALELSPESVQAYLGLARAFLKRGDLFKGLQAVRDARKLALKTGRWRPFSGRS
jgi:Tfp pilus assembly protein PilF